MKRLGLIALVLLGANWLRDQRWTNASLDFYSVTRKPLLNTVDAPGVLEAVKVANVKAEVTENFVQRFVREGDAVQAGQKLAQLTDKNTRIEFDQKKNSYRSAYSDLRKAKKDLSVEMGLYKNQAVARKNVDEARRTWERAKASFEVVAQEFALAEERVKKTTIVSPMAGVVLKDSTVGKDQVRPDQELYLVGDVSKFIVRAKVDELDMPKVRVGQPVKIVLDSYLGQSIRGTVMAVAMQAERETFAKVEVLVSVDDSGGVALKHNLSAQVQIQIDSSSEGLAVPLTAAKGRGGNSWVIVRDRVGLLHRRRVKLGRTTRQEAEILSGLKPGERVAVPKEARDAPRS